MTQKNDCNFVNWKTFNGLILVKLSVALQTQSNIFIKTNEHSNVISTALKTYDMH